MKNYIKNLWPTLMEKNRKFFEIAKKWKKKVMSDNVVVASTAIGQQLTITGVELMILTYDGKLHQSA